MGDNLVSAVEWWTKKGKWTCSLICYDEFFKQLWLESDTNLSFNIQPGRYCVGYTTLSSRTPKPQASFEPWKAMEPCPLETEIKSGNNCSSCYRADLLKPCLLCDGTECSADSSLRWFCQDKVVYVYLASFGSNRVKVGVAHNKRIPQRWIEQGANFAKRIIVGNGMEVRRIEKILHRELNVLSGLKTSQKVDTLWGNQNIQAETQVLTKVEDEIKKRFPEFTFFQESLQNLSQIYNLPSIDRRPLQLKVKKNQQISGKILGAKGSLLLLNVGKLPHYLNLKQLVGRKIELNETNAINIQTTLASFSGFIS